MGTLIDTSVFVGYERNALDWSAILPKAGGDPLAIAAITASELLHGIHRAKTPAQRTRREALVESILATIPVIPFDLVVARAHARVGAELARKGVVLGANDLQIGATALAFSYGVAIWDKRSFPKIPGLSLVVW